MSATGAILMLAPLCFLSAQPGRAKLNALDFGAVGDGVTNNQPAIMAAMARCAQLGGCELLFPSGRQAETVYRTSSIMLVSRLRLLIPPQVHFPNKK